jgi:hypothetical protein
MASGDESPWFPDTWVYRQAIDGNWVRAAKDLVRDLSVTYASL